MTKKELTVLRRDILKKGTFLTGGLVSGASAASSTALAKKGGSGVLGVPRTDRGPFEFYHEHEPFTLTSLGAANQFEEGASCMTRDRSAQKTPYPHVVTYENENVEEFLILAFTEEDVAKALDTSETFEFVSLTDCADQYGIARFRPNK